MDRAGRNLQRAACQESLQVTGASIEQKPEHEGRDIVQSWKGDPQSGRNPKDGESLEKFHH